LKRIDHQLTLKHPLLIPLAKLFLKQRLTRPSGFLSPLGASGDLTSQTASQDVDNVRGKARTVLSLSLNIGGIGII
jgi:hypothetical protein